MKSRYLHNNSGAALAYVVVALVVVSILASGLVLVSQNENYQAMYQTKSMKAYYIARAGAEATATKLQNDASTWTKFSTSKSSGWQSFQDGRYNVTVSQINDSGNIFYKIHSIGQYPADDKGVTKESILYLKYTDDWKLDLALAAYDGDYDSDYDLRILEGNVGSKIGELLIKNAETLDGDDYEGSDYSVMTDIPWPESNPDLYPDMTDFLNTSSSAITTLSGSSNTDLLLKFHVDGGGIDFTGNNTLIIPTDDLVTDCAIQVEPFYKEYTYVSDIPTALSMTVSGSDNPWHIIYLSEPTELKNITVQGDSNARLIDVKENSDDNVMIIVEKELLIEGVISLPGASRLEIYVLAESYNASVNSISNPDLEIKSASTEMDGMDGIYIDLVDQYYAENEDDFEPSEEDELQALAESLANDELERIKAGKLRIYLADDTYFSLDATSDVYAQITGTGAEAELKTGTAVLYGSIMVEYCTIGANTSIVYTPAESYGGSPQRGLVYSHMER